MTRSLLAFLLTFAAAASFGQSLDPLRNLSGTAANAGPLSPWVTSGVGGWTFFHGLTAHVTHVNESGPTEPRNEVFSTNWFAAGLHRDFGGRGFALVRGRVSLEPYTISDNDGYPQLLQYVPEVESSTGGPLVDRMRPQDLIGEAALHVGWRPTAGSLLHLYAGFVGDPALGTVPFAMRSSGADLPEAPFSYDLQETFHDSTSVITAGFNTRWLSLEASVFHDAATQGDHTEIDTGDIDSRSMRVTLSPTPNFAIQYSQGDLADDTEREGNISTGSVTYGTQNVAVSALWTKRSRDAEAGDSTAYGFEIAFRGARNTFTGRAEWVDRPLGFPSTVTSQELEQTTHFAVGYIFDFISRPTLRAGAGVSADYHTQSHELPAHYGHKPQAVFAFLRVRTGRL
jgi:hypothetical protein